MNRSRDACVSLRKTYNAILGALIAYSWLAGILAGTPVLYCIGFLIYYSIHPSAIASLLSTSGYSVFGILLFAWLIAIVSIWKTFPNLLTFTIFIYTCLGHWSLVSFIILIFYGFNNLPMAVLIYLCTILLPSIILLLISGDLMRAKRKAMFSAIEATSATAIAASAPLNSTSASVPSSTTKSATTFESDNV